jgi:hypothetical protein
VVPDRRVARFWLRVRPCRVRDRAAGQGHRPVARLALELAHASGRRTERPRAVGDNKVIDNDPNPFDHGFRRNGTPAAVSSCWTGGRGPSTASLAPDSRRRTGGGCGTPYSTCRGRPIRCEPSGRRHLSRLCADHWPLPCHAGEQAGEDRVIGRGCAGDSVCSVGGPTPPAVSPRGCRRHERRVPDSAAQFLDQPCAEPSSLRRSGDSS